MDVSSPMGLSLLVFILTTGNFHDVHGKSFLSEKRSLLRKPAASNFVKFRPNILIPGARPDGIAKIANKGKLPNDDGKKLDLHYVIFLVCFSFVLFLSFIFNFLCMILCN